MNVKYLTPFVDALVKVLRDHGIDSLKRGKLLKKEDMNVDLDVTSVVGISGGIKGNIAYSLSFETCQKLLVSMGLADSSNLLKKELLKAVGTFTELIFNEAARIFLDGGILITSAPPTIVSGEEIYFIISPVQTITIDIETPYGTIETNIGLEE
jgi:chemotaxis protein CheX